MSGQAWWHLARASGVVAWLFLSVSVAWGVLVATDLFARVRRAAWLLDLHRALGALTVVFTGVHVAALVADSYVHFGWADIVVPFASDWRTGPVALGVLTMWVVAIIEASSLVMRRLPKRLWRAVHRTSYVAFVLGSLHGTFAGSDATNPVYALTSILVTVVLVFAVTYRIVGRRERRRPALTVR